jgi:ABC-type phosphate/phosphonate transport system ATPase subunit
MMHPALLEAKTAAEILRHLKTVFFDAAAQRLMTVHHADFIAQYCHRADGLAWQRVTDRVMEQVNSKQQPLDVAGEAQVQNSYASD